MVERWLVGFGVDDAEIELNILLYRRAFGWKIRGLYAYWNIDGMRCKPGASCQGRMCLDITPSPSRRYLTVVKILLDQ